MCGSTSKRFIPEDRGRLVTAFLPDFFERYVEYNFTADLEDELDEISGGRIDWKPGAARLLEGLLRRGRRDQGPDDQRGASTSSTRSSARISSRPTTMAARPARLPGLRQRPAGPEARQVRRLHRLLELSGLPLHPPARHRRSRGRRRRRRQPRRAEGARHRSGDRQGRSPCATAPRPLRPARRSRGQGEAEARSRCSRA